jgi:N-methylhydantoinase A
MRSLSTNESDSFGELMRTLEDAEQQGRSELAQEEYDVASLRTEYFASVRYVGQSYELPISLDRSDPASVIEAFHRGHERTYGHADRARLVEVVSLRTRVIAPGASLSLTPMEPKGPSLNEAELARTTAWFDSGWQDTPVYDRERLHAGHTFQGPAIVVQMDSTVAVSPGWRATVTRYEGILLERKTE